MNILFRLVNNLKSIALLLVIGLVSVQCTQDDFSETVDIFKKKRRSEIPFIAIEYETESTTLFVTDEDIVEGIDIAAQTPNIEKEYVVMEIFEDGNVKMIMEKMTPSQNLAIPHLSLPNPDPVPHKTVIIGNKMTVYDEAGNIIVETQQAPTPKVTELVARVKELGESYDEKYINNIFSRMQSNLFVTELESYLNNPNQYGITMEDFGNGLVSVRVPIQSEVPTSSDIAVHLIDRNKNLLLASRLYDEEGSWKSSVMFQYDTQHQSVIKGILREVKDYLPSGLEVIMQTYSSIDKLSVKINL